MKKILTSIIAIALVLCQFTQTINAQNKKFFNNFEDKELIENVFFNDKNNTLQSIDDTYYFDILTNKKLSEIYGGFTWDDYPISIKNFKLIEEKDNNQYLYRAYVSLQENQLMVIDDNICFQHVTGNYIKLNEWKFTIEHFFVKDINEVIYPFFVENELNNSISFNLKCKNYNIDQNYQNKDILPNHDLEIKLDMNLNLLESVYIDNKKLELDYYSINEETGIITISQNYLNTLVLGKHVITINGYDGKSQTCFQIVNILTGDINGDSQVNLVDALMLRQYISGADVNINLEVADVTKDGEIKLDDALLLRRNIEGWKK